MADERGPLMKESCGRSCAECQSQQDDEPLCREGRPPVTNEIKGALTCPISHDFINDPVTIMQSGHTFDRESSRQWLLKSPARCPATNVDFGEKLQLGDSISARQILTLCMGDEACQKCNDSGF